MFDRVLDLVANAFVEDRTGETEAASGKQAESQWSAADESAIPLVSLRTWYWGQLTYDVHMFRDTPVLWTSPM